MLVGMITGPERIELIEMPEPEPHDGHAVVAIERCGICGTDVAAYRSGKPYTPFLHGHEWCGTVTAIGRGVGGVSPGDRVVCGSPRACGRCAECLAGLGQRCARIMDLRGPHGAAPPAHGGYATAISLDARRLVPVPHDMDSDVAAQLEPAAVAMHGIRRSPIQLGDCVVVQGCGPIGLIALQLARVAGAGLVIAIEPDPVRRALAAELGADIVAAPGDSATDIVRTSTNGLGAAVVVECAGTGSALDAAVTLARPGGWVTMIGVSSAPVTIEPGRWLIREVTVTTSLAHTWADFERAIGLVGDGRLQLTPIHSATVGLDGLADAFAGLAAADRGWHKVLVDPGLG